jgi:trk system potassium uptake protein
MNVLIAGGGRTGARLANLLINQNYKVRLIENRRELLSYLHQELPTEVIYEGNPVDPSVLEAAFAKSMPWLLSRATTRATWQSVSLPRACSTYPARSRA